MRYSSQPEPRSAPRIMLRVLRAQVSVNLSGGLSQKPASSWTLASLTRGPLDALSKVAVYVSFMFAKQPARIRSVLMKVGAPP